MTSKRYEQGDHVCVAYESPEEQLAVAVDYIADGLRRNERCLYSAPVQEDLERFSLALTEAGIDAAGAVRDGQLMLLTKHAAHLQFGRFDAEEMLHMLSTLVEEALNAGYTGLRTCGDMSWLLDEAPGSEQVVTYESLLHEFFGSVRATGMCQYDATRLPEGLLNHALASHRTIVIDGRHRRNPYFRAPAGAAHGTAKQKIAALRDQSA